MSTPTGPRAITVSAPPPPPVVILEHVGRTYPGPPPVSALQRCDLQVDRGEYVAVVGPSGSGKSTLLNVIGLLDRPTTGTYILDGIDTADLSDAERTGLRARRIGFVFQAYHLLPQRTAVENVMLAMLYSDVPRRLRRRLALATLDQVGLAGRADADAATLSGGEKQRVAISRALVNEPSLLLCDEPTGNLDTLTGESVLALFDDLHADKHTLIVITHDPTVARRGQRMVTVVDGMVSGRSS